MDGDGRRGGDEPGHIPYFPVWSIIVIALDVFVIWALLMPRRHPA